MSKTELRAKHESCDLNIATGSKYHSAVGRKGRLSKFPVPTSLTKKDSETFFKGRKKILVCADCLGELVRRFWVPYSKWPEEQKRKHTPGAVRATEQVLFTVVQHPELVAGVIDRETGAKQMAKALKHILQAQGYPKYEEYKAVVREQAEYALAVAGYFRDYLPLWQTREDI